MVFRAILNGWPLVPPGPLPSQLFLAGFPPVGRVGQPYSFQFETTGGSGTKAFSAASALPAGLTLSATGLLSGTPTAAATALTSVAATDQASGAASRRPITRFTRSSRPVIGRIGDDPGSSSSDGSGSSAYASDRFFAAPTIAAATPFKAMDKG